MNLRSDDAVRLADDIEAAASRDMYAAAPHAVGFRTHLIGGATVLLAPRVPVTFFNRTIGLGVGDMATQTDLDAIMDTYRAAGLSDYWIHLGPTAGPPQLQDWLRERGFLPPPRRSWAKFLRTAEAPPICATDLHIRPATRADAPGVAHTVCAAYGLPPMLAAWIEALVDRPGWRVFAGLADDRIVAVGALYLQGGSGWLGIGATLPDYRRRGAQSALLAERIRAAAAAGCTLVATETGEAVAGEPNPSLENIHRCGFTQVCSRLNFAAPH